MRKTGKKGPFSDRADHADVAALHTAMGADVELMRTSYRTQVFPRHSHDYFTVGVMLRGAGTLWYRGANCVTRAGDVVLIPPGEVHTGGVARGTAVLSYLAVHLPAEVLAACAEAQGLRGNRSPDFGAPIIRDAAVGAALRRLNDEMCGGGGEGTDGALVEAIGLLVRRDAACAVSDVAPAPNREPAVVRIAREVIEECFHDGAQTSLRALATQAGVTPFHLARIFTQTVGLPPHRYLVQTRIRRACALLARGTPSSFVAAMTGFADQSHLSTQFKRYVGTTPASYQRCLAPRRERGDPTSDRGAF